MDRTINKPKILIIDDNPSIVDVIRRIILLDGRFAPVVAYDGVAGIEKFYEEQPICVVVDAKMPGMDGFQFLRCLRGDMDTAATALVMLTALVRPNERMSGLISGADEYLTKPFRAAHLLGAIDRALQVTPEQRLAQYFQLLEVNEALPTE